MQAITWVCKFFDELSPHELYAIIKLRNEVFVVEQNCVFQDADNKDQQCYHLSGTINNELVAYARLVPGGVSYPQISIGRVITSPAHRKTGFGKSLMTKAIEECDRLFGKQPIQIGAQLYLKGFYQSFGFKQISDMYLEDDIPHIEMLRE
ncbi:GNAT family N-acetyltransferase [Segetibacter aerophilus]|uniref:GNAT family acetyltransferase n=1 Tax=Segetibacter aerophilus TaxID=670293 RepID=A0A512BBP7_9BACT|nr:GNAT family N-acetyltransferase [Segetibacter aerophilus]GEO09360.1 GNAT family acetyltransferase [Segetibacter aerophilus]